MGYAINEQNGMRTVNSPEDILPGETYYDELPSPWPPLPNNDQLAEQIRIERDGYLSQCDKITTIYLDQLAMVSAGIAVEMKYTADQYREILVIKQELRDLPAQPGFPSHVVWPERPQWV